MATSHSDSPGWLARGIVAGVALLSLPALASDPRITWDPDLAFEWDRANYEKTLTQLVRSADADVASWLGWSRTRDLHVRVVSKARYEREFGAGMAWNTGAHYRNGTVHVNGGARLDGWFTGMLAHELTHAYVDDLGTGHRLPVWLNEGLEERVGYRARGENGLDSTQRQQLEVLLQQKQLLPLHASGRLTPLGYLQSYGAVLFLEQELGKGDLLRIVRRVMKQGTFEQVLDAEARWSPRDLEERFAYWVGHLQ